jgi:hypothetical protein
MFIIEYFQIKIAELKMAELPEEVDDEIAKLVLDNCITKLVENVQFDDIKDRLIAKDILTRRHIDKFGEKPGNENKMNDVICEIQRTDLENTFQLFLEILKETKKEYLYHLLVKKYLAHRDTKEAKPSKTPTDSETSPKKF